jgi:transglutaminase-like putative cysteine protease
MRFAAVHKLASYLLALAGFAALALSGELPPIAIALTLAGGAASVFVEPSRHGFASSRGWALGWNVTSLAVFGGTALAIARGEPFLLGGAQALCFLLVNKLFNRRASRDYLQVYVLSFLMLVAGTALNGNMVFAACFLAYVVCATWALALLHLRREIEDNFLLRHREGGASDRVEIERVLGSRRVVGGAFLAVTSMMSAAIFALSAVFFFVFPRFGWNALGRHTRHGLTVGWNDKGVSLGDNGLVKDNEQVVMRVEFDGPRPERPLYFRGISFERYRGGRWTPSPSLARHALRRWNGFSLVGVAHTPQRYDGTATRKRLEGSVKQVIYLEPMEASVLFAAASPVALSVAGKNVALGISGIALDGAWVERDGDEGRTAQPTHDVYAWRPPGGVHYEAWSRVDRPDDKLLAAASLPTAEQAAELADYLDTDGVPPRVVALARRITAGAAGPAARLAAIQGYLHDGFRYSLRLVHDARKEPIEEFLFDRKQGHCEYFASSMTLLARAAGVPARHVAGFYAGEWNEVGRYLQIRQRDAHAWVEAWLGPEVGWVTYDPTPVATSVEERSGIGDRLRQMIDVLELSWFKYVIEYDLGTQIDLLGRLRRWLSSGGEGAGRGSARDGPRGDGSGDPRPGARRPLAVIGGIAIAAIGLWLSWRRRRQKGPRSSARRSAHATRAMERAVRALEKRGCERAPSDTPREILRRATAAGDPGAEAFADLVPLYYAARFGGADVDGAELSALAARVVRPPRSEPLANDASDGFDPAGSGR